MCDEFKDFEEIKKSYWLVADSKFGLEKTSYEHCGSTLNAGKGAISLFSQKVFFCYRVGGLQPGGLHLGGVGQTPLPENYGIQSTSGRYASSWNAFLLSMSF